MIDLLIKYPTRSRPDLFKQILTEYVNKLSGTLKVKFIISMDLNDSSCNNDAMRHFLENIKSKVDLEYHYGTSRNKIDACNRDVPSDGWKVCVLVSDDMTPRVQGYDKVIIDDMHKHFPDLDGALNYNCGGHAYPKVMVLSVIGNPYYKRFNYIYHPDYTSLFCDEEQTFIARQLSKMVDINHKIITHDWGNIRDDLRKHTEQYYQTDKAVFENRKTKGFPL
jgi:hypothetical protein